MRLYYPYAEDSLSGIFAKGIRKGLGIKYVTTLYPWTSPVENCFDGDASSFCHTHCDITDEDHYIQIQFVNVKFKIEGFAIQNRAGNYWDLQNYIVQGSRNGAVFKNISVFNEPSSTACGSNKIRTKKVTTEELFSFIRIVKSGYICNSQVYSCFNAAEFDFFGEIIDSLCVTAMRSRRLLSFKYFLLCFIILSKMR